MIAVPPGIGGGYGGAGPKKQVYDMLSPAPKWRCFRVVSTGVTQSQTTPHVYAIGGFSRTLL